MKQLPLLSEETAAEEVIAPLPEDAVLQSFPVKGMTCASCARRVERALAETPGVLIAGVNLATEKATVTTEPGVEPDGLAASVKAAGYELVTAPPETEPRTVVIKSGAVAEAVAEAGGASKPAAADGVGEHGDHEIVGLKRRLLIAASLSLPAAVIGMTLGMEQPWPWVQLVLVTPVQFWAGAPFLLTAWRQARHLSSNMDTLIALGTLAAYFYSVYALIAGGHVYFETSGVIITFLLAGRYAEHLSKSRASQAIRGLLELEPKRALVIRDGEEIEVAVDDIAPGDLLRVRPGDRVPADGVLVEGEGSVDEASFTGEPVPADKVAGDEVWGATVNTSGSFVMRAERVGSESAFARVVRLVDEAQGRKAPIEKLADKVSSIFVPVVLVIAAATFTGWMILGYGTEASVLTAVSVLIIACPCAMGLATPAAIMVGTGRGAQLGILIRGGEVLERSHLIDVVLLDKTGTVTEGKMSLVAVVPEDRPDSPSVSELLRLVASAEERSEHPIGRAIVAAARKRSLELAEPATFESLAGSGVAAEVEGKELTIGRRSIIPGGVMRASADLKLVANQLEDEGMTVVWVADRDELIGVMGLSDTIRSTSAPAIERLKAMGLAVALVTGDNETAARSVAGSIGIESVVAGVLPEGKVDEIKKLQKAGHVVAMVGDGINDAPALAQADLGIAVGSGAGVALEAADVTLMRDDPGLVPTAIHLSRRTLKTIKQNLFWAFFYNTVMIPAAIFGLLDPMIAAAAMAGSSVSVVLNALRLRRVGT